MLKKSNSINSIFSINKMRNAWKHIKEDVRNKLPRDIIDWADEIDQIEFSLTKNVKEKNIHSPYISSYRSYEIGKEKGSYRNMVDLSPRSRIIFDRIAEEAFERAQRHKISGSFFITDNDEASFNFVDITSKYIVVTDVSNYYNSISHTALFNYLKKLGLPVQVNKLLRELFERYSMDGVGIPVDGFNFHGKLAHIYLFEHDKRMATFLGEGNYFRYLDDQYFIVENKAHARFAINYCAHSLQLLSLRLNVGKTQILSTQEASIFFELDSYSNIRWWINTYKNLDKKNVDLAMKDLRRIHGKIRKRKHIDRRNYDKVLIQLYEIATKLNSPILERYALKDLIDSPRLDKVIFEYFALRNRGKQMLSLFLHFCRDGENFFEYTEMVFFESALFLDPSPLLARKYCRTAELFIKTRLIGQTKKFLGIPSALLLLYWFGRSKISHNISSLINLSSAPKEIIRSWIILSQVSDPSGRTNPKRILSHHVVKSFRGLYSFLSGIKKGKTSAHSPLFLKPIRHKLLLRPYYSPRTYLLLDLISQTETKPWLKSFKKNIGALRRTSIKKTEISIIDRIEKRL